MRDAEGSFGKHVFRFEEYVEDYYPPYCNGRGSVHHVEVRNVACRTGHTPHQSNPGGGYLTGIAPLAVQPDTRFMQITLQVILLRNWNNKL